MALRLRFGRLDYFLGGDLSGEHLVGPRARSATTTSRPGWRRRWATWTSTGSTTTAAPTRSNPTLLGQLDPAVSIVSVGADNPHGHPHPATLQRLLSPRCGLPDRPRGSAQRRWGRPGWRATSPCVSADGADLHGGRRRLPGLRSPARRRRRRRLLPAGRPGRPRARRPAAPRSGAATRRFRILRGRVTAGEGRRGPWFAGKGLMRRFLASSGSDGFCGAPAPRAVTLFCVGLTALSWLGCGGATPTSRRRRRPTRHGRRDRMAGDGRSGHDRACASTSCARTTTASRSTSRGRPTTGSSCATPAPRRSTWRLHRWARRAAGPPAAGARSWPRARRSCCGPTATPEQGPRHLAFKLSAAGGQVALRAAGGTLVDEVRFPALATNEAWRAYPDGERRLRRLPLRHARAGPTAAAAARRRRSSCPPRCSFRPSPGRPASASPPGRW